MSTRNYSHPVLCEMDIAYGNHRLSTAWKQTAILIQKRDISIYAYGDEHKEKNSWPNFKNIKIASQIAVMKTKIFGSLITYHSI
jgi:hypothetical protein